MNAASASDARSAAGRLSKKESASFLFALKHVHASHCPDRLAIATPREDADGTAAQLALRPNEIGTFFLSEGHRASEACE